MSGKRDTNRRAGDRSEDMAKLGLLNFAFVSSIPRQEDFGVVDLFCVLARREGKYTYPASTFFVQVKSTKEDLVYDADAIRWISHHMDHPLFLCVVDKKKSELIFYSLSRIWLALFLRTEPKAITLKLDIDNPPAPYILRDEADGAHFEVMLGPPILRQELSALEADPSLAFSIFETWIRNDAANIARRRLGRLAVRCFWDWQPNTLPAQLYLGRYYASPDYGPAEKELAFLLTALGYNYERSNLGNKLEALRGMLRNLKPLLDETGLNIANGTSDIAKEGKPDSGAA